ncbi:uncharacterized protein LOC142357706, partial [Convolutriloba macropyga]|uniref:uncharacterized protein LOC142357706 n=1 Tax=Convolutriloba macropyga TaxID=536237 RepID=UPI003F51D3A2
MDYGNKEEHNLCDLRPFEDYHYYDLDISLDGASDLNLNDPVLSAPPKSMLVNSSSCSGHNAMPAYPTTSRNFANNPGPPPVPVSFLNHGANSELNVDNRGGGLNSQAGMPSNLNIPGDSFSGFGPPGNGVGMPGGGPSSHLPTQPNQQTAAGANSCLAEELMNGIPLIPPPPPINASSVTNDQALNAMLMSWYMVGYHSGYYLGLQHGLTSSQVTVAAQSQHTNIQMKNFPNNSAEPSSNAHANLQSSIGQQSENANVPVLPIQDLESGTVLYQVTDRKSNKQNLNRPHQVAASLAMNAAHGIASMSLSSPHQITSQVRSG